MAPPPGEGAGREDPADPAGHGWRAETPKGQLGRGPGRRRERHALRRRLRRRGRAPARLRRRAPAGAAAHLHHPSPLGPQRRLREPHLARVDGGAAHAGRRLGTSASRADDEAVLRDERLRHRHAHRRRGPGGAGPARPRARAERGRPGHAGREREGHGGSRGSSTGGPGLCLSLRRPRSLDRDLGRYGAQRERRPPRPGRRRARSLRALRARHRPHGRPRPQRGTPQAEHHRPPDLGRGRGPRRPGRGGEDAGAVAPRPA
jgi:hypothetical protein